MQTLASSVDSPAVRQYIKEFIDTAPYRTRNNGMLGLRPNSIKNYTGLYNAWYRFELHQKEGYSFNDLDKQRVTAFKMWLLNDCGYAINHAGRMLSMLKTIGLDAQKNNHSTHPYVAFIHRFSLPAQDKIIHTLSFKEMKKVEETIVPLPLENAKKWLIIGFWIGQRVSDLLTLQPEQVRAAKNGGLYVDVLQQKTSKKVTVGVLHPKAIELLTVNFPKKMYPCAFNKKIKEILKLAGINEMVKAHRYNGKIKRKETGIYPKYAVIASHDLRRSFATNFYGKIPTPILMNMTGHAQETTFMQYIGMDKKRDGFADDFMQGMSQISM